MSNEVLVKQERNAWAVVLKALGESGRVIERAGGADSTFQLSMLNDLVTSVKRVNTSYAGGTTTDAYGLTDLFVSPEVKGDIRAFAYQPITTANTNLPDSVREGIYSGAGTQEIYGISIHELVELGESQKYQTLFSDFYSGGSWDATTDELIIGLDLTKDAFVRPVARQAESGGVFTALPDDQFVSRSEKIGFYGFLEEGRVCIDSRAMYGLTVSNA